MTVFAAQLVAALESTLDHFAQPGTRPILNDLVRSLLVEDVDFYLQTHANDAIENLVRLGVLTPAGKGCFDCGNGFLPSTGKPHTHRFTDPPLRKLYAAPQEDR